MLKPESQIQPNFLFIFFGGKMKSKIFIFILLVLFVGCSTKQTVEDDLNYKSSFGFSSRLSMNWLVLTKDQIKNNPGIVNFENKALKNINKSLLTQVKQNILSGKTEIMYSKSRVAGFGDNINVLLTMGNLITKINENKLCTQMPQAFKSMFKRYIQFYECGLKTVGNLKVLYLNFEGVLPGTRSAQYQFQTGPGKLVIATLTCKNRNYEKLNKDFNDFVRNIKLDRP